MKEVVLREEEPPDDTVVVVRGGEMNSSFVRRTAQRSADESGYYAVSVFLALDVPVEVLCALEPYVARYGGRRAADPQSGSARMTAPWFEPYDGWTMTWDLWVDYHRTDGDGLTHANVRDAEPGVALSEGDYVVVGHEEADPAVAEVVSIDARGIVLVRVLPGPAEEHLHLTDRHGLHRAG